jgi:hypothetical protein
LRVTSSRTSPGSSLPRSVSTFASTRSATAVAFAPGRLASVSVTAGCSEPAGTEADAPAGPGEKDTALVASPGPSTTRATSLT